VAECSVVDPKSRQMLVKSSNLSGASLMVIEETCKYSASPAAPTAATLYKQEAKITAFLPFLAGKVRSISQQLAQSFVCMRKNAVVRIRGLCLLLTPVLFLRPLAFLHPSPLAVSFLSVRELLFRFPAEQEQGGYGRGRVAVPEDPGARSAQSAGIR